MKKLTYLLLIAFFAAALPARAQKPNPRLLTPDNGVVLFIDHQPQMAFSTKNIKMTLLRNNLAGLSKATTIVQSVHRTHHRVGKLCRRHLARD